MTTRNFNKRAPVTDEARNEMSGSGVVTRRKKYSGAAILIFSLKQRDFLLTIHIGVTADVPDEIGRVNGSSMTEAVDEGVIALKVSTERGLVDVVEV